MDSVWENASETELASMASLAQMAEIEHGSKVIRRTVMLDAMALNFKYGFGQRGYLAANPQLVPLAYEDESADDELVSSKGVTYDSYTKALVHDYLKGLSTYVHINADYIHMFSDLSEDEKLAILRHLEEQSRQAEDASEEEGSTMTD